MALEGVSPIGIHDEEVDPCQGIQGPWGEWIPGFSPYARIVSYIGFGCP
jgi:hypothetical protein